jgi:hypothetical protein
MRGQHEARTGERSSEAAGQMSIPSMAMHDVRLVNRADHHDVAEQCVEQTLMAWILCTDRCTAGYATYYQVSVLLILLAKSKYTHAVRAAIEPG